MLMLDRRMAAEPARRSILVIIAAGKFPTPPASAGIVFDGDEGRLSEAGVRPRARAVR
jgi:hypothetical protein